MKGADWHPSYPCYVQPNVLSLHSMSIVTLMKGADWHPSYPCYVQPYVLSLHSMSTVTGLLWRVPIGTTYTHATYSLMYYRSIPWALWLVSYKGCRLAPLIPMLRTALCIIAPFHEHGDCPLIKGADWHPLYPCYVQPNALSLHSMSPLTGLAWRVPIGTPRTLLRDL